MMDGGGKSDEAIVAGKPMNKAERSVAESVERRAEAEGNASQFGTDRIQSREDVSQGLERIRQAALPSTTRGGSRMRESRTYGSVRGALSNERPYRDRACAVPTIHPHRHVERWARQRDARSRDPLALSTLRSQRLKPLT
jgi:hypothetical protein